MSTTAPDSFAVIDFETTGARAAPGTVIEVGIVVIDRGEIVDRWSSLVNPEVPLPPFIVGLTGIDDEMLRTAPQFGEIAETVREKLEGRVMVAHNASFDRSYLRAEMGGMITADPWICTVKMSRALMPGFPSYSLDRICASAGVERGRHHRALSDAEMTARLFLKLWNGPGGREWVERVQKRERLRWRAEQIDRAQVEALSDGPGLLYWHGEAAEVLFLRRCRSIRETAEKMAAQGNWNKGWRKSVIGVSGEPLGSLLVATLMERLELVQRRPIGNTPPIVRFSGEAALSDCSILSFPQGDGGRDVVVVRGGEPIGWYGTDPSESIALDGAGEPLIRKFPYAGEVIRCAGLPELLAGIVKRDGLCLVARSK